MPLLFRTGPGHYACLMSQRRASTRERGQRHRRLLIKTEYITYTQTEEQNWPKQFATQHVTSFRGESLLCNVSVRRGREHLITAHREQNGCCISHQLSSGRVAVSVAAVLVKQNCVSPLLLFPFEHSAIVLSGPDSGLYLNCFGGISSGFGGELDSLALSRSVPLFVSFLPSSLFRGHDNKKGSLLASIRLREICIILHTHRSTVVLL